jgi:two-component system CheB/CheR fusion protein
MFHRSGCGVFFTLEAEGLPYKKELREMVLFANHNVLKDPPFSRLDLITCRNMLIYLNPAAQNRVMETFHFALNPGGYLFLGSSESVDGANDLYVSVSKENQVFQSRQTVTRPIPVPEGALSAPFRMKVPATGNMLLKTSQEQENRALERISLGDLHLRLLEQYAPPSVIINENHDIVHISEKAGKYMQVKGGEPSNNILKLIRQELRLDLRTALYQAVQKQSNIEIKQLTVQTNGHAENINLHIRPVLSASDTARGFILIVFEPSEEKHTDDSVQIFPGKTEPLTLQLEEELTTLKAQVRSTNEHFEVQTEEIKASNEELAGL